VQGAFVSDSDITDVVDFLTSQTDEVEYNKEVEEHIENTVSSAASAAGGSAAPENGRDEYFADSGRLIIEKDKASIGMLQRAFKIGFNRAARIMDQLAEAGVVGGEEGTKPRKILMTLDEFEQMLAAE
jgi:S-DNA-T family DNA segregation ATPase FtsK/SpoIIIE